MSLIRVQVAPVIRAVDAARSCARSGHRRCWNPGVDFDGAAADVACGGQSAGEFGPGAAAVGRAVDAALGAAAAIAEDGAASRVRGGVEHVGACGIDGDIADAGVLVDVEGFVPGGAAIGGHEDAAIGVGAPEIAERGHVDDVGVGGVDHDAPDVVGVPEADGLPGFAGVHGLLDAVAPGGALAIIGLAGSDVEDRGVIGRERDIAD